MQKARACFIRADCDMHIETCGAKLANTANLRGLESLLSQEPHYSGLTESSLQADFCSSAPNEREKA